MLTLIKLGSACASYVSSGNIYTTKRIEN